jgi:thioredoxin:protein disulfide reductase
MDVIHKFKQGVCLSTLLLAAPILSHAEAPLLAAQDAFALSMTSKKEQHATLDWKIADHYYIYQHKVEVQENGRVLALSLPQAEPLQDENYGQTHVYYHQLQLPLSVKASSTYQVTWQGCAKDRLCYPPQTLQFHTDAFALVSQQNAASQAPSLLDLAQQSEQNAALAPESTPVSTSVAKDQHWFAQLSEHSFAYGLMLFFGLGLLLAFTPCSLPMLPILSSLIVRERKGVAAWGIALTFVLAMASVYAILGLVASSAGLGFQRWLQQPSTLLAFSGLFVVFALNLFGLFELKLPQRMMSSLDRIQGMQKGGSLVGAGIMGMLSALLVGPCMTAPLAGALLFISQTQQQGQGALLLFTLGLGMGTPLFLASILGAKVLPKAGEWMHQVKVLFAFIMLALALYFVRPLCPAWLLQILSLSLGLSFVGYVLYRLMWHKTHLKGLYLLALIVAVPSILYSQYQHSQRFFSQAENAIEQTWQVARTATEFEYLLANAPTDRAIVIDVYADWCVACQPIEQRILTHKDVQQALGSVTRIKLDLSHYDASHQALLNQWQVLGPPTYLFLNAQQQEQRSLRLTGAFSAEQLLEQLKTLKP